MPKEVAQDSERLTYTIPEVATKLGISRNHAYEMARRNVIPTIALGRRRVCPREALERMLRSAGDQDGRN